MTETRESHHINKRVEYVVCMLFSDDLSEVCLIEKTHPEWQNGLLNGVGGKIEPGETIIEAARREFKEETGVEILDWQPLCLQKAINNSYIVHYLVARNSAQLFFVRTMTDEQVGSRTVKFVDPNTLVASMSWMLPLAVYALSGKMDKELIHVNF